MKNIRPLISGALIAATLVFAPANARDRAVETALLTPRSPDSQQFLERLPRPLSMADTQRYRRIFSLQEKGEWAKADRQVRRLDNRSLMGHVLAQRYLHPTAYRSRYVELAKWLKKYNDLPDASRIYRLALKRQPSGASSPRAPRRGYLSGHGLAGDGLADKRYRSPRRRARWQRQAVRKIEKQVLRYIRNGMPTKASKYIKTKTVLEHLDEVEIAKAKALIGHGYYLAGMDDKAYLFANVAADQGKGHVPRAYWTAGLAAWRLGNYAEAQRHFEALALSDTASTWNVAAGAYWAARVHLVSRRPGEVTRWLVRAAQHGTTFYGLIARRALGLEHALDWSLPTLTKENIGRLMRLPGARRAMALLQIGDRDLAEKELRKLYPGAGPDLTPLIMTIAVQARLPALAMRIAGKLDRAGHRYVAGLYPVPDWQPNDGFSIDKALVFALVRQESSFDFEAKSPMGARGLMQVMPRTASYIAHDRSLRRKNDKRLFNIGFNLAIGQDYVEHLQGLSRVGNNLYFLFTAYNGGPGNLRKWMRTIDHRDDPLLFIESIPSRETRRYIKQVTTNYWMYRMRLNKPTPSLDMAAAGDWPRYGVKPAEPMEVASLGKY